jgi:Leucine-rich repeat (LRR) protein
MQLLKKLNISPFWLSAFSKSLFCSLLLTSLSSVGYAQRHSDIDWSRLCDVPSSINTYDALARKLEGFNGRKCESLFIHSNSVEKLPKEIFYCGSIHTLGLGMPALKTFPEYLYLLKRLKDLSLTVSNKKVLDANWSKMDSLEELGIDIEGTAIKKLPSSIGEIPRLKVLDIWGFSGPIPEWIFKLKKLEELSFNNSKLDDIDTSMAMLKENITWLELNNCNLKEIPKAIMT